MPCLSGLVLPAGVDYQLIRPDGFTALDARYVARLDDCALPYIVNIGSDWAVRRSRRASPPGK